MSEEKYITMYGKEPFIIYNDYWSKMREKDIEIERLNNIINELENIIDKKIEEQVRPIARKKSKLLKDVNK